MAKNQATATARGKSVIRDRSSLSGSFTERTEKKKPLKVRREILFPLEPSTIGDDRIDRAIDAVMSRKK
ncbi:MAG: hypothetical protein QOC81_3547 [Thermoanaerobaculia bacterium]|jgi:hypothetical protein|nr:hypothetical protein [Thermoanaerobaculia bacterium]